MPLARIRDILWRLIDSLTLAGSLAAAIIVPESRPILAPVVLAAIALMAVDLLCPRSA